MKRKTRGQTEDTIKNLMEQEGLMHASSGFTSRVMDQVKQYRTYGLNEYKPLIGVRGWVIVSTCVVMLVACCIMVLVTGNDSPSGNLDFLKPVFAYFQNLEFSLNIHFGSFLIGAMVCISIAILLTVDFVFSTKISLE